MPNDTREARAESLQVLFPWGTPAAEASEGFLERAALWLSGGASLLLWTAIALLLTSA